MERRDKYLAFHMIDAVKRDGDPQLNMRVEHDSICESPLVKIEFNQKTFDFQFGHTPFNSEAAEKLMRDKRALYDATKDFISWPHTEAIPKRSDVSMDERVGSIKAQIDDPTHPFKWPIIIKPSEGTLSRHVYHCDNEDELREGLNRVSTDSGHGDHVLVQQCLGDEAGLFTEMRAFCFDGHTAFIFDRQTDAEIPHELLTNPTQWPGLRLSQIQDEDIVAQTDAIASHMKEQHGAVYFAIDVMCDRDGKIWMMEANSSPMSFAKIETSLEGGPHLINSLTEEMIAAIKTRASSGSPSAGAQFDEHGL